MTKFKTQFQGKIPSLGEINSKKSKTLPDQTITIRRLLENHVRGIPSPTQKMYGMYTGIEVPNITDLTDIQEMREELKERRELLNDITNGELNEKEAKRQAATNKNQTENKE